MLAEVRGTGTGTARRKLFSYRGVHGGDQVAPPDSLGRLGLATPEFNIAAQLLRFEANPNTSWADLTAHPHPVVEEIRTEAPPHGPWARCTENDLRDIFAIEP